MSHKTKAQKGSGPAITVTPVAAAIGVVLRGGEVLLIRRANQPDAGKWGFPGGKIEPGEPVQAAAARKVAEETGLVVRPLHVSTAVDAFHRNASGQLVTHYVLIAVLCEWVSGVPQAAGDALEAEWFPIETLESVNLVQCRRRTHRVDGREGSGGISMTALLVKDPESGRLRWLRHSANTLGSALCPRSNSQNRSAEPLGPGFVLERSPS